MANIEFVGELQRVDLRPGDRFVIHWPGRLAHHQHQQIAEAWYKFVGVDGPPVFVLDHDAKIGVIREEHLANDNRCPHTIDLFEEVVA